MVEKEVLISNELKKKYSGIKFGFLFVENIKVEKDNQKISELRNQTEEEIRRFDYEYCLENRNIKSWINQFKEMELNLKQIMPAQVVMIKKISGGKNIPNINVIVDLANIMACRSKLPVGVFDLDKISGNIILRISKKGEKYLPLFEEKEEEIPENEIVYGDGDKIFSRYSKDCDITKITPNTNKAFFVIDGTKDVSSKEILGYLNELESLLKKVLNANITRKGVIE